jgi:HPt (histidine-containing phosphotransfer) domain-containing protein
VFDKAGMMAQLMDDEHVVREVVVTLLQDIPGRIEALRQCMVAGDAGGAERRAHSIASAAANVCAEALHRSARDVERAGRSGNLEAVQERIPDLETQFVRLKEELERHFGRVGP